LVYRRQFLSRPWVLTTCDGLGQLAREVGVDDARFARCLDEPAMRDAVERDFEDGVKAGLYGTPTFYVNGAKLVAPSGEELEEAVRHALEQVHRMGRAADHATQRRRPWRDNCSHVQPCPHID
jgi:predicted DsbA family dithiol-disulfide isomerase